MSTPAPSTESACLLDVRDLGRAFTVGDDELTVLRGISFRVNRGEFVAIIGPSGSGKSTLRYELGGLDSPTRGTVHLLGRDLSALGDRELAAFRNRFVGFVFQTFNLLPRTTAVDNVALPLRYAGVPLRDRRKRALEALAHVGLSSRAFHPSERLSGGERQRVAIARAIVTRPLLILGDEPTGNLDQATGRGIVGLFENLNADLGSTIILVTHDMNIARRARRVIRLVDGRIEHDGTPFEVLGAVNGG